MTGFVASTADLPQRATPTVMTAACASVFVAVTAAAVAPRSSAIATRGHSASLRSVFARRQAFVTIGGLLLGTVAQPALAKNSGGSDGAWAAHEGPFSDEDFKGFSTTSSGLGYKIVEEGYGVKPNAGQGIKAHYSGYLLNGAKFDSSYDRRSPLGFNVGTGRVIKGWDEALVDMKVGEKRVRCCTQASGCAHMPALLTRLLRAPRLSPRCGLRHFRDRC